MEFRCWMGVTIEGKSYIIAEKIRYKEKTSDDVWTEYGLVTRESNDRTWLSIADNGLSCSLSAPVGEKIPRGYRLRDRGTEVVTAVWGDTDAAVGDEATYEQYETADGKFTFFIENWSGKKSASMGRKIAAADIAPEAPPPADRLRAMTRAKRARMLNGICIGMVGVLIYVGVTVGGTALFFGSIGDGDFSARDWHDFRSIVNLPYAMHERLSDAPYYTEQQEEDGARVYTAQIDPATAALDLVEGMDGRVEDAYEEIGDAAHPLIIRTQMETARITSAADGTAYIVVTVASPDLTPAADRLRRSHALLRYAESVRTGDTRGRAGVVLQESPRADTPSAAPADSAASATEAANHTAAPAPTTPTGEETPRQMRHLAH